GFEFVSGLADGASAVPAKWIRPVFSFRFFEGKISRALRIGAFAAGTKPRKKASPCPQKIVDDGSTEGSRKRAPIRSSVRGSNTSRLFLRGRASPMHEPGRRSARLTVQRH